MAGKKGLLTPTEFAKLIGVSPTAVRYAIGRGRITVKKVKGKKLVEPEAARKEWQENTDKTASKNGKKKGNKPGPKDADKYTAATFQGLTTADADRREKVYKAKLSELKYLEQAGELVDVRDIKREAYEIARRTRDAIMNMPARLAHELAAETDPHKLEIRLTRELTQALEHLVNTKRR